MRKIIKKSITIVIIAIFCIINSKVKADFDQSLGTVVRSSNYLYNQTYKYSTNGYAVFCTAYSYHFGSNCYLTDDWDPELRAGVAYILKKAEERGFRSTSISSNQNVSDNLLQESSQITLAINALIHNKINSRSTVYLVYGTNNPANYLNSAYQTILAGAETEYDRVKGSHDVEVTRISKRTYIYNPAGENNHPQFKFHITNTNLNQDTFSVSLGKHGANLPDGMSLKLSYYNNSDFADNHLITTKTLTGQINNKINTDDNLKNLSDFYLKIELIDNRDDKTAPLEPQMHLTVDAINRLEYDEARSYYCNGKSNQTFTPFKTEPVLNRYVDSAVVDIYTVEVPDYPSLEIVKVDKDNSNTKLSGAKLEIYKNNGSSPIKTLTTNINGITTFDDIEIDKDSNDSYITTKYCIKEKKAPSKYNLNTKSYCFNIEMVTENSNNTIKVTKLNSSDPISFDASADNGKGLITVTIPDEKNKLRIKKVDDNENPLPGVTLELVKKGATEPIVTWTTTSDSQATKEIEGLEKGTYYVNEISVPDGYVLEQKPLEIKITGNETGTIEKRFINYKTSVAIAKLDEGKHRLSGASLQIIDENNIVVFGPWNSKSNEDKVIEGVLGINKIYYLEEISAPAGYSIKPKIKFQLKQDGTVEILEGEELESEDRITLTDDKNTVKVKKTDVITNEPLKGAYLQLLDNEGKIIKLKKDTENDHLLYPDENGEECWITDEEEFTIDQIPIGTYAIHETHAPDGYKLNNSDVVFTVENDGKVTINGHVSQNKIVIYKNEKNSLTISKKDITGENEVPNAQLQIIDKTSNKIIKFKNTNGVLEPDDNGDEYWVSSDKPQLIRKLKASTYILKEILAPAGYVLSTEEIEFTIDNQGNIKVDNKIQESSTLIMTNDNTRVYISKQDITTKEELPGATLILKDENGVEIDKWVSDIEPHPIVGLVPGTYTLTETIAPEGYQLSEETITFTIDKNGALSGNTIMYNTPIPEVPNTLSTQSLIITLVGLIIISGGVALYIYGIKKKKEI